MKCQIKNCNTELDKKYKFYIKLEGIKDKTIKKVSRPKVEVCKRCYDELGGMVK